MLRRLTLLICASILALSLGSASFGEDAPPPPPPAAPSAPVDAPPAVKPPPSPAASSPSLCVVNSLRLLNSKMIPQFVEQLKLSEDQKTKLTDILAKSDEAQKPLLMTQRRVAEEFVNSLVGPTLQEPEVMAGADLAIKTEGAVLAQRVKALLAVRQILTADQIVQLDAMISRTTIIWRPSAVMERLKGTTPGAMPVEPATPNTPAGQPK